MTSGRTSRTKIDASRLDNGIKVLTETIPGVRSAAVGIWIKQGSAHETGALIGSSHMLEHMAFKGTTKRSARDLATVLEAVGGSLDAYTSREHTSYQARILDENIPEAIDVLADLVLHPTIQDRDLAREKDVVLEELATVDDTPDDLVFELHGAAMWGDHPYGNPILGTRETVSGFATAQLSALHRASYAGGRMVIAAAGNVHHGEILELVEKLFAGAPVGEPVPDVAIGRTVKTGLDRVVRDSAQSHIVFGCATPGHTDPDRYAMVLSSAALGGGMSSRLFQRIREELALAYSVYSFQSFYAHGGISGVYIGTRPSWTGAAVEAIQEEFADLSKNGLMANELEATKRQVKGQIMLSLESTSARLYRLAGFALYDEPFLSLDDLLSRIDGVTMDDVKRVAAKMFDPEGQYILCLGPDN